MPSISNDVLLVEITTKGAELQRLFHRQHKLEYLWSGDPGFWAKKSPVLFPIVGGLKENRYFYKGKEYHLNRHGFAREQEFQLVESTYTSLSFQLNSNAQTKAVYPFDFLFEVTYSLQENKLQVTFIVENTGQDDLLFSVGAHPAFAVPFEKGSKYEDFYLEFNQLENEGRWPLSEEGLIETSPIPFFHQQNKLALKKELFYKDAIVLKNLNSDTISILSHNTSHGVKVQFDGFPYMGIWAAKDADFICLEPWCGVADTIDASGNLEDKEGIQRLAAGRQFERTYTIEVF